MSKINLDSFAQDVDSLKQDVDSLKQEITAKHAQINKLLRRIDDINEKIFYFLKCEGCGQTWDAMYLTSEYDRIYSWKIQGKKYAVVDEHFKVLTCPTCKHEHAIRGSYNQYEKETNPENGIIHTKTYAPENLIKIRTLYNSIGRVYRSSIRD